MQLNTGLRRVKAFKGSTVLISARADGTIAAVETIYLKFVVHGIYKALLRVALLHK